VGYDVRDIQLSTAECKFEKQSRQYMQIGSSFEHIRGLAAFVKVVEMGSFRRAAQALELSPSIVSHYVATLESRLGVSLLHRSTRAIAVTPKGDELYAACSASLSDMFKMLDATAAESGDAVGTLRISMPVGLVYSPLQFDLAGFARAHPAIALCVHYSDMRHTLVDEGYDLILRINRPDSSALKARKLFRLRESLVASPDYIANHPTPVHPRNLATWDWLYLESRPRMTEFRHPRHGVDQVWGPDRLQTDSIVGLYEFARIGMGLAVVPDFLMRSDLDSGRVVEVLPEWRPPATEVYALWPRSAPSAGLTARLISYLTSAATTFDARFAAEPRQP
jgi:DNA-binding transcriptional LysR family regulator